MNYKLLKKFTNSVKTTFHVVAQDGAICGSINVQNSEVPALLKCWSGQTDQSSQQQQPSALMRAFAKVGR